jgi:DNA-binding transcriptional MerR regulator
MQQNGLLTINQVSDLLEVPKPTLRFWEKELDGIIVPLRTDGGQRRYTAKNISVLEEIKRLRKRGMSLAEIKGKLGNSNKVGNNSNSDRIDLLAERVAEVVKAEVSRFLEGEAE